MKRIALGIEYDGSGYLGWQRQEGLPTIQSCLEDALSFVADHSVEVICAGRTDAGVHALGQVVHFDSDADRKLDSWLLGGNSQLSPDICIRWVRFVDDDFHARFSATSRRYMYSIYNNPVRSSMKRLYSTWHYPKLDDTLMKEATPHLLGEHDFSAYRAAGCQAKHPIRTIEKLDVQRHGEVITITVKANAFLHHMVRNIAGVLMIIGEGKQSPNWAKEVLESRDRQMGGMTASPNGLCFVEVTHPDHYQLPRNGLEEMHHAN